MTPGARLSAAIEIVDAILLAARQQGASADRIIADYFKSRRYAGSKDRRAVRALVWQAVRRFGDPPADGRAAFAALAEEDEGIDSLFDGQGYGPRPLTKDERRAVGGPVPDWLTRHWIEPDGGIDKRALLERAPLDIRVNALRADRAQIAASWPEAEILPDTNTGLRLPTGSAVENSDEWKSGLIEIQDHGSQLIVESCKAAADMTVLDLCAGAGGKALALSATMGGRGRVVASDTDRGRLSRLGPRAARAGATNIEERLLDPGRERDLLSDLAAHCDIVLVDAPCSGSGTWRRNPETRWRLTEERLMRLAEQQARLIDIGADLVRPGGALVYAVCALTKEEGPDQVDRLLSNRPEFMPAKVPLETGRRAGQGRVLTPCHDGSDGFFFARLEKNA